MQSEEQRLERTPAQFFFDIGFGAAYAQGLIQNDMKPPFAYSDALVKHAWEIAGEAHDDHEEFDRYLALANASVEGKVKRKDEVSAEQRAREVLAKALDADFPERATNCRNGCDDPMIPMGEAIDAMLAFASERPRVSREALVELLTSELGDAYDCSRVWEAWSVGTMGEDDFVPVNDRAGELATAILTLIYGEGE